MNTESRLRLKAELSRKGIRANALSIRLGYAKTYISRLITGNINEPSARRVREICESADIDWNYILTGEVVSQKRQKLLDDLNEAPDALIDEVVAFVRKSGLGQ